MSVIKVEFCADKLRRARGKRIQSQVAQVIGISRQHLSQIEQGKIRPNASILARLCLLYEVELRDLTTRKRKAA